MSRCPVPLRGLRGTNSWLRALYHPIHVHGPRQAMELFSSPDPPPSFGKGHLVGKGGKYCLAACEPSSTRNLSNNGLLLASMAYRLVGKITARFAPPWPPYFFLSIFPLSHHSRPPRIKLPPAHPILFLHLSPCSHPFTITAFRHESSFRL